MTIKLFAILTLLPCLYVVSKIHKRKDISCYDIIIVMNALYLGIVPLTQDSRDIYYNYLRNDVLIQFLISAISCAFSLVLILADTMYSKSSKKSANNIINITGIIRSWNQRIRYSDKIIFLLLGLLGLLFYIFKDSLSLSSESGSSLMERREYAQNQSSITLFLHSGGYFIRLLAVFLLTTVMIHIRTHRLKLSRYLLMPFLFLFIIWHLQISRTYLLESLLFVVLIKYSIYKDEIRTRDITKFVVISFFTIAFVFPIVNAFRAVRKIALYSGHEVNIVSLFTEGVSGIVNGTIKFSDVDNTASRSWSVYSILGHAIHENYQGHGELTFNAISKGIPKVIYPNKSKLGSQGIIEMEIGNNDDVSDSFLLVGVLESKALGFLIAASYYFFILWIYNLLLKIFSRFGDTKIAIPVVISFLFMFLNRVDYSPDEILPSIVMMTLWYFFILYSVRLLGGSKLITYSDR